MINVKRIALLRAAVTIVVTSFSGGMFANSSRIKFVRCGSFPFGLFWATSINVSYACFRKIVARAWYVVFSSWIIMNTAVFCLPMSSMLKSLYESISLNCSREANSLIFCLNTDKILPFVSFGAFIVLDANTYGLESSPFKRKYSFV